MAGVFIIVEPVTLSIQCGNLPPLCVLSGVADLIRKYRIEIYFIFLRLETLTEGKNRKSKWQSSICAAKDILWCCSSGIRSWKKYKFLSVCDKLWIIP